MSESDSDLAEILAQFTNLIMNERVKSYNEGLDAGNERNAKLVAALQGIGDEPCDSCNAAYLARRAIQQSTEKP